MRITYRIWDRRDNRWFIPQYQAERDKLSELTIMPNGELLLRSNQQTIHESKFPSRYVTVLSSQLKDKNNQEIFEGDLLGGFEPNRNLEVCYTNGGFTTVINERLSIFEQPEPPIVVYLGTLLQQYELEVVGNIFEHRHLLTKLSSLDELRAMRVKID